MCLADCLALDRDQQALADILELAINDPELVMIIGCIGLALNVLSATVLHGNYATHETAR